MTRRIFRAILFSGLAVLLAAMVLVAGTLYSYFTKVQFHQLRVEVALAAHAVEAQGLDYFDRLDDLLDSRVTWIGTDGTVLYDNLSDSGAMENHLAREEVIQAWETGYGQSARYSQTLLESYLYAAERLPDGTILRISTSRSSVFTLLLGILQPLLLVVLTALALSALLARRLAADVVRPLNRLNLENPLANPEYEEIQPLMRRLSFQQSQLRAQAQALTRQQQDFNTITQALQEGLVLLDRAGTILSINPAAARLLEVTPNCAGADFRVASRCDAINELVLQARQGQSSEQTLPLARGEYLAHAHPVLSGGQVSGVVLLFLDVTQKRQAEALRREFTANVSHELKTPLHAISGYAELLKSGLVRREDSLPFYEKIYAETQRLIRLVEDILRLSRLDEGAADMPRIPTDLYLLAREAVESLRPTAERAQVRLTLSGSSAPLEGIPQLLSGILLNLTDNAIKYNRVGGSVSVSVSPSQGEVVLIVRDTGIGIPPDQQERIFERFYRVDKSHSKEVGGTGLGLSIVKHAALIHRASIGVSSTPGEGTTLTLRFPTER